MNAVLSTQNVESLISYANSLDPQNPADARQLLELERSLTAMVKDGALPFCPHLPTPKQRQFLDLKQREVLYGGSAGGGKSDALLMGALQWVNVPGYSAIIFRRTLTDLELPGALISRSREWLSGTKAKWNGTQHCWTFPNGATLAFGYMDSKDGKYRYQGSEFQFIGFDELTQFQESDYTYLFSRLRKTNAGAMADVPLRMRTASNPGGRGHDWVKKRFMQSTDPERVFLPAGLKDNPYLDADYRKSLAMLDFLTRSQLEDGDWNITAAGNIFKKPWFCYWRRDGDFYRFADKVVKVRRCWNFITVDLAISEKAQADWTVIQVWAVTPGGHMLLLDQTREKMSSLATGNAIRKMSSRWKCDYVAVEATGYQMAMAQQLREHGVACKAIHPKGDKVSRASAASVRMEAGMVHFPAEQTVWLPELEAELLSFPEGSHDDQVDCLSYAANEVQRRYAAKVKKTGDKAKENAVCSAA